MSAIRARTLRLLVIATFAAAMPSAAFAQTADLMPVWRQLFARPDAGPETPPRDPLIDARAALGRDLFRDPRLSRDLDRACASCHRPDAAFTDGKQKGDANDGGTLQRNTPALYNLAWAKSFYWDGRAPTLEEQAARPIEHPREMAGDWPTISKRLKADSAVRLRFDSAFSERPSINRSTILVALATYERSLVSPPTRFDRWIAGDANALAANEVAGFRLFTGRAGCVGCHSGWRFTDDRFHDIGLPSADPGRGGIPGGIEGLAAFKTPSLRELRWTAPYMHDGSKGDLNAVLDHYAGGAIIRPGLSTNMVRGLTLSTEERASLLAFLAALSSPTPPSDNTQDHAR
jgi:cytochrome c peroxidase